VDSDTNDSSRIAVSNDTPGTAQSIPNPITLGGYISVPEAGAEGPLQFSGDIDDFFVMDLVEGQSITMLVADFRQADADLYLYDALTGELVDFSIEIGELERIRVPASGRYLVNVFAFDGATNYILAAGTTSASTAASVPAAPDIVPWQAVVKFRDSKAAKTDNAERLLQGFAMEARAGGPDRPNLLGMRSQTAASIRQQRLGPAQAKLSAIRDPQLLARWETLNTIKALRSDPAVEYAEPNYIVRTQATPNDNAYPLQWHYPLIGLPEAWETTTGNEDVIVAVVDTGILSAHPDFAGKLVPGYDFVRDTQSAGDGDGIDANPEDSGQTGGSGASSYHGTHVAGTIAARGNNEVGVAGAAFGARVMPLRALGVGGEGTSYDVDQAVRFAAGLSNDSGTVPAVRADIINLSLGGAPFSSATQALFDQVRAAGVMAVAAAGNEATTAPGYPASYEGVISVSAVDLQRRVTRYSNTGAAIDVAAPGGDSGVDLNGDGYPDGVLSTDGSPSSGGVSFVYSFLNGTSMASPHVAAVLALMKSVNPQLTPADIDALLSSGELSDDLGPAGRDNEYGHGLINAQRAVLAAVEATGTSPALNPRLASASSSLSFGNNTTELDLLLRNGGRGELEVLDISTSESWLSAAAGDIDADGLGIYRVSVDRSGLSSGVYAASITATSSVNEIVISVLMTVGGSPAEADVGTLFVLLYDLDLDEVVDQFIARPNDGSYAFSFDAIPPGRYEIGAGTDADNDLFICDAGEACGTWLTLDQPIVIDLQEDLTDIDFPVDFQVAIPTIGSANVTALSRNDEQRHLRQRAD
tara:strand:+ start:49630 stop:52068 length:2439 start_codon:yes stop_codon:yes gene_type:complete